MDKRKILIGGGILILVAVIGFFGYQYYQKSKIRKEAENMLNQLTAPASDVDIHVTNEVKSTEGALTAPDSAALSTQANDEKIEIIKQLSN